VAQSRELYLQKKCVGLVSECVKGHPDSKRHYRGGGEQQWRGASSVEWSAKRRRFCSHMGQSAILANAQEPNIWVMTLPSPKHFRLLRILQHRKRPAEEVAFASAFRSPSPRKRKKVPLFWSNWPWLHDYERIGIEMSNPLSPQRLKVPLHVGLTHCASCPIEDPQLSITCYFGVWCVD